ncbi:hypothetical protein ANOM_009837 [Aspergillus nomiae NRRL 13137]|uniref:Uncharacterized protein n=1 Tax=Aspergillus nomiae NRRL (strain ATCC 15546 / NRRL 13137 / CBS 260.88 / M93) TaxID=1509407 RepID=A0A0L1IZI1_ASPN3|nr:uncharacterized protein ANOM_009837 [Aspergillus nomiae NRRL 13137]KNG84830.1 hypothetical protein ANOM_009837 [Aspergillus nomiae NRRL 13137]
MAPTQSLPPAPAGAADASGDTARPLQKRVLDLNREAASLLEQHSPGTSKPHGQDGEPPADVRQSRAGGPSPCHYQSNHNSASSAPACPADLNRDRALTVKVSNPAMARNLRQLTNEDLVKRAEEHRWLAAITAVRPTLASIQFIAAKILWSGDLRLFLRNAKKAEIARTHRDAWIKGFGTAARVALASWGVVATDMPSQALGPLTEEADRKRIAQELVSETALYDRASRIVHCNNYHRYGHIENICPNETVYGACAGKHSTTACRDRDTPRLPGTKSEAYIQEREKARGRALHRPRFHHTPAYLQDPDVGSATGSAAHHIGPSSGEPTETESEDAGGSSKGARNASDDSAIEGLRFTGNTPPQGELSINTLSTLTSIPTIPPTLSTTGVSQDAPSSGTKGTRRSARLVQ